MEFLDETNVESYDLILNDETLLPGLKSLKLDPSTKTPVAATSQNRRRQNTRVA